MCRKNVRATLIVNRQAARELRPGGALINLACAASPPPFGLYAATRATTDALTRTLSAELSPRGITVAAVALEAGRPCDPAPVADLITLLIGDPGRALAGQVLRI
jgi:short-subunit dehydrogenase